MPIALRDTVLLYCFGSFLRCVFCFPSCTLASVLDHLIYPYLSVMWRNYLALGRILSWDFFPVISKTFWDMYLHHWFGDEFRRVCAYFRRLDYCFWIMTFRGARALYELAYSDKYALVCQNCFCFRGTYDKYADTVRVKRCGVFKSDSRFAISQKGLFVRAED